MSDYEGELTHESQLGRPTPRSPRTSETCFYAGGALADLVSHYSMSTVAVGDMTLVTGY